MRCPRCSALMETWPYDLAPFCTYCGFVLERRKTDRQKKEDVSVNNSEQNKSDK